ncbi:M-phase inducer phosphatase 1-like [Seriola lalandi dorsalis]|uniref:M-phase inducer phosphatase n=1 Tax=Seriola lalandi dorsalis TaxID=1841481 RepID=A0A3B4X5E3_SERLL|nr:M-phase inducer phosphatase 1-like [Seriola lalandi dorsalis]XP_056250452.1 M-phase inducer phosphatase 2 [Seriola aureovittata]
MESVHVFGSTSPVKTGLKSRPDGIPGLSSFSLSDLSSKNSHCRDLFSPGPATVLSPVTNLALDMNNLAGLGSQCDTPKRRKHAPLEKVPSFASDVSSDAGLGMDPPSPMDAVEVEDTFEKAIQQSSRVVNERIPIRRINSLPPQLLGFSPSLKGQEDSHRYGIFGQQPSQINAASSSQYDNKENMPEEGFEFKKPTMPVSRSRVRSFNCGQTKDAFARRPSSAPALMFSSPPPVQHLDFHDSSPMFLRRSSLTSPLNHDDDDGDDGFLDELDDNMENNSGMPMGMASLLTAPLVSDTTGEDSPVIRCRPRSLFRSPSMPSPVSRPSAKRPDCPGDENTPVRVKRRRSLAGTQPTTLEQNPESPRMSCSVLQRSKSFCQTDIEKLLDNQDGSNELIGDFTKPFVLPTVEGKHQDLKYITSDVMVAALTDQFNHLVERVIVIDCRYPYEFEGGHIKGALNLHQEEQVSDFLLKTPIMPRCPEKRVVIIFHCEFSSERGPRMCRFVRERDRAMNDYPKLHYPELYILKGGYKDFFPPFQSQCEPQSYRPMHHEDFKEDLRKFRLKSRTWAGERSKRDMYSRLKKL